MLEPRHKHDLPAGTQAFGMGLFLTTLTMLFAAGLLLYWILRLRTAGMPEGIPLHTIRVPWPLFVSTPCMLAAGFFMHHALRVIRRGHGQSFKAALAMGTAFSILFVCIQTPALWELASEHWHARARLGAVNNDEAINPTAANHAFYGSIFFLIVIHAVHVLGGLIPLGVVWFNAGKGRYTQQDHAPVRMLVWYWHFLDIVWLVLFGTFLVLG